MTIIEQNLRGKHTEAECEDGIVVSPHFVAVIDGSTSKSPTRLHPDMANGRYAMTLIAECIREMPREASLESFCESVTRRLRALYPADDSRMAEHPEERLCASAVVYSDYKREVWMVGDCQCLVDGEKYENSKPSEEAAASRRAELFEAEARRHPDMTDGRGHILHDYARDAILPQLIAGMQGENRCYAVLDGFPVYMPGVKTVKLNGDAHEIVLASDGYPFLCPTLAESEGRLARQLADDPYNIHSFKATKGLKAGNASFDDRAFIRFCVPPRHRYFAWLSFDGTAYHGWQIQPNGTSVQAKVQQCLSTLLGQETEVVGAGRTDAGVHARQMACHFDSGRDIDCAQLTYRLNRILPQDISCQRLERVGGGMHARFSATRRTYRYFIHTAKDPFARPYSVETHYPLDFTLMNEAAGHLKTVSDFRAFCKAGADNLTTRCQVSEARWVQASGTSWYFEISANRFLRNMVRAVVGTLFDVGRHRVTLEQFRDIVAHGSRSSAGESMPAKGLFLWEVAYDPLETGENRTKAGGS